MINYSVPRRTNGQSQKMNLQELLSMLQQNPMQMSSVQPQQPDMSWQKFVGQQQQQQQQPPAQMNMVGQAMGGWPSTKEQNAGGMLASIFGK